MSKHRTSPSISAMRTVVEVGDWEHECCGPSYERDTLVEVMCLVVSRRDGAATRYVESHHDLTTQHNTIRIRGRVVDICIQRLDGSIEQINGCPVGVPSAGSTMTTMATSNRFRRVSR